MSNNYSIVIQDTIRVLQCKLRDHEIQQVFVDVKSLRDESTPTVFWAINAPGVVPIVEQLETLLPDFKNVVVAQINYVDGLPAVGGLTDITESLYKPTEEVVVAIQEEC